MFHSLEQRNMFFYWLMNSILVTFQRLSKKSRRTVTSLLKKEPMKNKSVCPICKNGETVQLQSDPTKPISCLNPFCDYTGPVVPDAIALWKLFGKIEPVKDLRLCVSKRIRDMGQNIGFISFLGCELPNLQVNGVNPFIDVVWQYGNKNVAIFKVVIKSGGQRIAPTLDESASLVEFEADEKYVVNVSEKNGKVYFHRVSHFEKKRLFI